MVRSTHIRKTKEKVRKKVYFWLYCVTFYQRGNLPLPCMYFLSQAEGEHQRLQ